MSNRGRRESRPSPPPPISSLPRLANPTEDGMQETLGVCDVQWGIHVTTFAAAYVHGSCHPLHDGLVSLMHWSGKGKPRGMLDAGRPHPLDHTWKSYDLYIAGDGSSALSLGMQLEIMLVFIHKNQWIQWIRLKCYLVFPRYNFLHTRRHQRWSSI